MRFVKASEKMPDGVHKKKYHVKYKDSPEILVFLNDGWYWFDNGFVKSMTFPVDKTSWSAIEWLDEQADELMSVEKGFPKYEYESRCINRGNSESKTITAMAAQGYRLVAVSPYDIGNKLYFERLIVAPQPPKQ